MARRDDRLTTDDLRSDAEAPDRRAGAADHDEPGLTDRLHGRDHDDARAGEAATGDDEQRQPLLPRDDLAELRRSWEEVQTRFVDEPRRAVEDADALVADLMRRLADVFSTERTSLEQRWEREQEVDTEVLRVTLQRYRSFFNRLLSA